MRRLIPILLLVVAILIPHAGCTRTTPPAPKRTLKVLAAVSLADALREVGTAFETANPGVRVEFIFAGSNQLRTQLENAGPGDVFASADRRQMDAAITSRSVDPATIRAFAQSRLALIVPANNSAAIHSLSDLARPNLKIVVADSAVPAGNYTRLMLEKARTLTDLGPRFVAAFDANTVSREENVAAVVTKISLNEADAGIAYATDALGANAAKLTVIALPPELEQRIEYVAAVTARPRDRALAANFVEFLSSPQASGVFTRRGFIAPGAVSP